MTEFTTTAVTEQDARSILGPQAQATEFTISADQLHTHPRFLQNVLDHSYGVLHQEILAAQGNPDAAITMRGESTARTYDHRSWMTVDYANARIERHANTGQNTVTVNAAALLFDRSDRAWSLDRDGERIAY